MRVIAALYHAFSKKIQIVLKSHEVDTLVCPFIVKKKVTFQV